MKVDRIENQYGIEFIYKPENSTYSDQQLKIIPSDYMLEISEERNKEIVDFISNKFPDKEMTFEIKKNLDFVDSGINLESITCPNCGHEIDFDFWLKKVDTSASGNFKDLKMQNPCCGKSVNLNELNYSPFVGFSKYQITIIDPELNQDDEDELIAEIEKELALKTKLVWASY